MVTTTMTPTGQAIFDRKLSIADVFFVTVIFLISFIFATNWLLQPTLESIPLAPSVTLTSLISALAFGIVLFYTFSFISGRAGWLSIFNPFILWGPISIIIWTLFNGVLSFAKLSTAQVTSATISPVLGNVLIPFLGTANFNFILQVVIFGTIESLILAIVLGVFVATNKGFSLLILAPAAGFMALAHTAIAISLSPELSFQAVLYHQFFTFMLLGLFQVWLGTSANVSAHWYKNILANQSSVLVIPFVLFTLAVGYLTSRPGDIQKVTKTATLGRI